MTTNHPNMGAEPTLKILYISSIPQAMDKCPT